MNDEGGDGRDGLIVIPISQVVLVVVLLIEAKSGKCRPASAPI
jgi:hypothetical protein